MELNVVDGYLDDTGQRKQLHYTFFRIHMVSDCSAAFLVGLDRLSKYSS